MKKFWFTVILICLTLICFFTVAEICFRIFRNDAPPLSAITQKKRDHLFEPHSTLTIKSSAQGEYNFSTHINSLGYRGPDFLPHKDPHRIRIFAVGDSFTFSMVPDDFTIPHLIEDNLKKQGYDVEVINAGIGHASPLDYYMNLKNIHLQYQPDIVLVLFDLTDLWDDWHKERSAVYNKNGEIDHYDFTVINGERDWWLVAVDHSAFCRYIHNKVVRSFQKVQVLGWKKYFQAIAEGKKAKALIATAENVANKNKIEYDGLVMMRGKEKKELILEHWPRTAGYLKKIKTTLDEENIPVVLIMYPHGIYVGKDQWAQGRLSWGFEAHKRYTDLYPFELVGDFAKNEAIPFVNTLNAFPVDPKTPLFYDSDGHLNEEGNKIVAQAISSDPQLNNILKEFKR
jgi:hypothetical protein